MKKVDEAIKVMGRVKSERDSLEDILKKLELFGKPAIKAILESGSEEIKHLINAAAEEILNMSKDLPSYSLRWIDNKTKMHDKLRTEFPSIYKKIEEENKQHELAENYIKEMGFLDRSLRDSISAKTPDLELDNIKKTADEKLASFVKKSAEEITRRQLLEKISDMASNIKECLHAYIEIKREAKPFKILYYKTSSGGIACKIGNSSCRYSSGMGRAIRVNKGQDSDEYPLIISAHSLIDIMYHNAIDSKDSLIDAESIEEFYYFDNKISHNLTPSFVESWYNYDCPDLYRCMVNKSGEDMTMLGEKLPHFTHKLVEHSYYGTYIEDDITEREISLLAPKGYEYTMMYREMQSALKAKELTEDKIDKMLEKCKDYEGRVQKIVDDNEEEIIEHLKNEFRTRIISEDPLRFNDMFGLDCGFISVYTRNPEYAKMKEVLKNTSLSALEKMEDIGLRFPYNSQSLTFMEREFEKIREVVKREIGEELYCKTMLD